MEKIRLLLWADRIAVTRWFTTKSFSKFIVAGLFFLVFTAVAFGIYEMCNIFFRSLALYQQFGELTAKYIIHAAVIIILWLAIGSSIASVSGIFLSASPSLSYLLAIPVSSRTLNIWLYIKSVIANFLLMAFAFIPIAAAYGNAFGVLNLYFLIRILLILLCIVLITSAVGTVIALVSVIKLKGREYQAAVIGILVFFSAMIGLLRLIFPPDLSKLYDASSSAFLPLFNSLPLNNPSLPTAWMAGVLTGGSFVNTILVVLFTAAIVIVCLNFQRTRLIRTLLRVRSSGRSNKVTQAGYNAFSSTDDPLVLKDWYSIVRLPSEKGYGLFLASIAIFFFLMLSFGIGHQLRQNTWSIQLIIFSFVWIAFFSTAFFLRFLYPLIAREGKSAWYLFAMPIRRKRILLAKIQLGILISVPVMIFTSLAWYLLPFIDTARNQVMSISIVFIFILAVANVLFGAIYPNFSQGNEPEKVSTSGMGLLVLLVSGVLAAFFAQCIQHLLTGVQSFLFINGLLLMAGIVFLSLLWLLSGESMKRWEW